MLNIFPFKNVLGHTKLVVIGGWLHEAPINKVQVIDLEDESKTCNRLSDYPINQSAMTVGVINGVIKSCGGNQEPSDSCYDYHPESNTWVQSVSMEFERSYHAASFIDDVWMLSGGGSGESETTTEVWNGTDFELGPPLTRGMSYAHCQLTLNATHVFFGHRDNKTNLLLNWQDKTYTMLPPISFEAIDQYWTSCGLINNPERGREAVIAGYNQTQIFNFNDLTWRPGPNTSSFMEAGYTQLSDTFIVVGGYSSKYGYMDKIHKFDNINYDWIELNQHLETSNYWFPGAVMVPDSFVTCN